MDEKKLILEIQDPSIEELNKIDNSLTLESDEKILNGIATCDTNETIKQHLLDLKGYKRLTPLEELDLAKKKTNGDEEARKQLILCNYRLVLSRAKILYSQLNYDYSKNVVEFLDFVSWGTEGLIKAVDKFDYTSGTKFSTYATYWIDCYIKKNAKENNSLIPIPANVIALANKIKKITNERGKLTPNEIWEILKIKDDKLTLKAVKNAMAPSIFIDSLDRATSDDDETTLLEKGAFPNQNTNVVINDINDKETREIVEKLIKTLKPKEQLVVALRCGYLDDIEHTFDDIGKRLGISKQAANQIFNGAVNELKKSIRNYFSINATSD